MTKTRTVKKQGDGLPDAVTTQYPELAARLGRRPLGAWDVLPPSVEVYVPIQAQEMTPAEETQRAKGLVTVYGLCPVDATRHAQWENTKRLVEIPAEQAKKIREETKARMTSAQRAYIAGAGLNGTMRIRRAEEVRAQLDAARPAAVEQALEEALEHWQAVVKYWRLETKHKYTVLLDEAAEAWERQRDAHLAPLPKEEPFDAWPGTPTPEYCETQAERLGEGPVVLDLKKGKETGKMQAAAAIIGAYSLEAKRLGLEGEFFQRAVPKTLVNLLVRRIDERCTMTGKGFEEVAGHVLRNCPRWMRMRKDGRIRFTSENLFYKYDTFWGWQESAWDGAKGHREETDQ